MPRAIWKLALPLALAWLAAAPQARAQVGALQIDCDLGGKGAGGGYQFVATCAGRAVSPDQRLAIVQRAYDDAQPPIELQDAAGRTLATLPSLSDDMPFAVFWSPTSRWFFVNHHVGSFMDVMQVFEVVDGKAVERPALPAQAARIATRRYPCLPRNAVLPNGARWTRDGRAIVLVTISRPDACETGKWEPLWMIGQADGGGVDAKSIRVQPDDRPLSAPEDGPYAHR